MNRELCNLEKSFTKLLNIAFVKYPLRHFIRWASFEPVDSAASLLVGPVISAHLYRGKRGLEHEFVLISFGHDSKPTSWLRAERAARAKTSALHPRWDSFGPLFSGVPPLDTISFAASKDDLISLRDLELATLVIIAGQMTTLTGMFIRELSEHFAATVNESPDYILWSANCRFFARRTMINIAVRLGTSHPDSVKHLWGKDLIVSLPYFLEMLQAERFGGSALIGIPATLSRVRTLLMLLRLTGRIISQLLRQ